MNVGEGLRHWLRDALPGPIRDAVRRVRRSLRRASYNVRRLQGGASVSGSDIAAVLADLGIGVGDDVLLHSSMRGLGVIVGGAEAVVAAVVRVLGPEGTLLVPAYPLTGSMLEHLERGGIALDVRSTPSQMGKISDGVERKIGRAHV